MGLPRIRSQNGQKQAKRSSVATLIQCTVAGALMLFVVTNFIWMKHILRHEDKGSASGLGVNADAVEIAGKRGILRKPVRQYPPHRYYNVHLDQQPDFLTSQTEYIYGEWPILLPINNHSSGNTPIKIPVNQSEWEDSSSSTLPFADGTNPSILTISRIAQRAPQQAQRILQHYPDAAYLTTVCMTDSQCSWKDGPLDVQNYHLSTAGKPTTVRTVLILLNQYFVPLDQTTIYLQRDAPWGKRLKQADQRNGSFVQHLPALDDARLFVHNEQIWVSYREGRGFGWDAQVLNPIHMDFTTNWQALLWASETTSFCCGRNMALMNVLNDPQQLHAVTWVDPVTTIAVDTTPLTTTTTAKQQHRRLAARKQQKRKHKSHIHGTNAFMVDLPGNVGNYLGVAHFHRPNDRKANPYARFGHHYTHAFYTINQQDQLTGLSAEFVLPSAHVLKDAEIIQFASGLELVEEQESIVLAYGINDCEAAIVTTDLSTVQRMLRPVAAGKQVVDFMKPLYTKT